jgi:hypothetical protein
LAGRELGDLGNQLGLLGQHHRESQRHGGTSVAFSAGAHRRPRSLDNNSISNDCASGGSAIMEAEDSAAAPALSPEPSISCYRTGVLAPPSRVVADRAQ